MPDAIDFFIAKLLFKIRNLFTLLKLAYDPLSAILLFTKAEYIITLRFSTIPEDLKSTNDTIFDLFYFSGKNGLINFIIKWLLTEVLH